MDVLNSYLFQHKSISLPGLGTLYMERIPAQTDFVNRQLLPPGYSFRFDKYFDAPDEDFFGYIAQKKKISDYEAIRWYNEFTYDLRAKIRNKEKAVWEGIGTFHTDEMGEIFFKTNDKILRVLKPVKAERILREDFSHNILVGDKERTSDEMSELLSDVDEEKSTWIKYAIILAAVSIAILFYQFYLNGYRFDSGNQTPVPARHTPALSR